MSSVIVGSRCMTASSSNDEPSQDGLFHRLRGWPPLGAATSVEGPCLTGQHAEASGGLRPVVLYLPASAGTPVSPPHRSPGHGCRSGSAPPEGVVRERRPKSTVPGGAARDT